MGLIDDLGRKWSAPRPSIEERDQAAWEAQFWKSPAGQARLAFHRGDEVLQLHFPLIQQNAYIAAMVGAGTRSQHQDWSAVLNEVVREGWEIVSSSVVFVETGSQSRDKFMASGQQIAVSGQTVGYYLFKRNESLRNDQEDDDAG